MGLGKTLGSSPGVSLIVSFTNKGNRAVTLGDDHAYISSKDKKSRVIKGQD